MTQWKFLGAAALAAALMAILPLAALAQTSSAQPADPKPDAAPPERHEELLLFPTPVEVPPSGQAEGREEASFPLNSTAFPGGGFSPLMSPTVGHAVPRVSYRDTWYPDEHVAGQPTNLGYLQQDLAISFPLWQDCADEWSASINTHVESFHTHAILPDTGQPFPDDLWNLRLGTTYRHLFDNGWIGGGSVSIGSASDQPFHSLREMTAGVNAFLRVPQGEHNAWLFSLSYSPTSELAFPIPGVAYVYAPSDRFLANIGLPFLLMYRPLDDLTLDFSYMLIRTVHARATYRLCRPVRVYAGFDWSNESYFLADRVNDNDRFFYYDKRLSAGVQTNLGRHVLLDLSTGYVFDRFYFEGRSYSDRNFNRIDVGNGPFLSLQGQVRW